MFNPKFFIITARKPRSLSGGLCPGVSVQGRRVSVQGSLSRRWGSLSKGESLSSGVLCLCPEGGLCLGGLCLGGLCPGESVRETPRTVKSGQYASYWNAFLFYFVPSWQLDLCSGSGSRVGLQSINSWKDTLENSLVFQRIAWKMTSVMPSALQIKHLFSAHYVWISLKNLVNKNVTGTKQKKYKQSD